MARQHKTADEKDYPGPETKNSFAHHAGVRRAIRSATTETA